MPTNLVIFIFIVGLMTALWVSDTTVKKWILKRPSDVFCEKYDGVQQQIMQISCLDDLLTGRWTIFIP